MKVCSCEKHKNNKCSCLLKTSLKPLDFWDPCTIKKHEKANWNNNFCELRKQWSNIGKCPCSSSINTCANCIDKWKLNYTACHCNSIDTLSPHTSSTPMCLPSKYCPCLNQDKQCRCPQVSTLTNSFNKDICGTLNDLLQDLACLTNQIRLGLQTINIACQEMNSEINDSIETSIAVIEKIMVLSQETCKRNQDLIDSYSKLTNLKEKIFHINDAENNDCIMKNYNTLKQMASVIQNIADQSRNSNGHEQMAVGSSQVPEITNSKINHNISDEDKIWNFQKNPSKSFLESQNSQYIPKHSLDNQGNQSGRSTMFLQKSSKSLYKTESPTNEQFIEQTPKNESSQSRKTLNFQQKSSKSLYKPRLTLNKEFSGNISDKHKNEKSSKSLFKLQNQEKIRKQTISNIPSSKTKSFNFSEASSKSRNISEIPEGTRDSSLNRSKKSIFQEKITKSLLKSQNPSNINEEMIQNIPNQKRKSLNFAQKSLKSFHTPETRKSKNIKNKDINCEQISSESLLNFPISESLIDSHNKKSFYSKQSMKAIYRPEIVISEQNLDTIPEIAKK